MPSLRIALRDARKAAGLSQMQLAEKAGVRQATVSEIERGTTRVDLDVLARLAEALRVEPGDLLEREGKPRRKGL